MSNETKLFISIGCFFLATAGALAAFGFHGPEDIMTPQKRESWAWAVEMQYYHGGGLLLTGILINQLGTSWWMRGAAALMIAGVLIFSFIVYLNTLGVLNALSGIVPNGGSMLMASWLVLAVGVLRSGRTQS